MRTALIALLAFAAGVLLMVGLARHTAPTPVAGQGQLPAAGESVPATASTSATTDEDSTAGDNWPAQAPSPEQVMYGQRTMVQKALAQLGPRSSGRPNLYVVAFGADGGEDVFRNEAEYAARMFPQRFGADTHVMVLENNPGSLEKHPLASWSNL